MKKIYIAGHSGFLGSAILKIFREKEKKFKFLLTSRKKLDLRDTNNVNKWFRLNKPNYVIVAAAAAGGIMDNIKNPVKYILDNILIQTNIINSSHKYNVKKLIFIGSSCVYPKFSKIPIKESSLLTGQLEPTNQWYAISKIHGIKLCEAINIQYKKSFFSVMPTNLYGPNDKYDERSHVIAALIKRFHDAKINKKKEVVVWGTGNPKREFLYVDDCGYAIYKIFNSRSKQKLINIGTGKDISIYKLALLIKKVIGFRGNIVFDRKKPDGVKIKTLDISLIRKIGWKPKVDLEEGLKKTYENYKSLQIH
jgi:GDP-L-fucose synthase